MCCSQFKVHVWGGLSRRGPTDIVIFTGIMDAEFYTLNILPAYARSAARLYPHGDGRMWADNDPKHNSKRAKQFLIDNDIPIFKTPAESPDLNPIELAWHSLKMYFLSLLNLVQPE